MKLQRGQGVRRAGMVASCLVLALGISACGEDKKPTGFTVDDSLAGDTIKVGVLMDVSSPANLNGPGTKAVIETWQDYVNSDGGVGGHKVEVVLKDSKGDTATAAAAVNDLAADEAVVGVMLFDSAIHPVEVVAAQKANLPVLGGFLNTPGLLGTAPDVYGLYPALDSVFEIVAQAAKDAGSSTVAVLQCTISPACNIPAEYLEAPTTALGLKYVGDMGYNMEAPNYTANCLKVMDQGADFVYIAGPPSAAKRIMLDCRTQGYKGAFSINLEVTNEAAAKEIPDNFVVGTMLPFPWFADQAEPVAKFQSVMNQVGIDRKLWADNSATAAWAGLELFRAAHDAAADLPGTVTRQDTLQAYSALKDEDLDGLVPEPMKFKVGKPQAPLNCLFTYQFKNGEFSTLHDGLTPTCGSEGQ